MARMLFLSVQVETIILFKDLFCPSEIGMYMCDKPLPQQKLANQLAEPPLSILKNPILRNETARLRASLSYISAFWITMVREWPSIDKYRSVKALSTVLNPILTKYDCRTDKYYSLMRSILRSTFRLLKKADWNEHAMREVHTILTRIGGPL